MDCPLCASFDDQQVFVDLLTDRIEDQGAEDWSGVDWVGLKRKIAYETATEDNLTLTALRRHVEQHVNWEAV